MKVVLWIIVAVIAALALVMLIAFVGRGPSLSQAEANYCADLCLRAGRGQPALAR